MRLNWGCLSTHDDLGKPDGNVTHEVPKRAAAANKVTVEATLTIIARSTEKNRGHHPMEFSAAETLAQSSRA